MNRRRLPSLTADEWGRISAASQPSAHMTALPASEVIPSPNAGECPFIYERGVVYLNPALLSPAGMKVTP